MVPGLIPGRSNTLISFARDLLWDDSEVRGESSSTATEREEAVPLAPEKKKLPKSLVVWSIVDLTSLLL